MWKLEFSDTNMRKRENVEILVIKGCQLFSRPCASRLALAETLFRRCRLSMCSPCSRTCLVYPSFYRCPSPRRRPLNRKRSFLRRKASRPLKLCEMAFLLLLLIGKLLLGLNSLLNVSVLHTSLTKLVLDVFPQHHVGECGDVRSPFLCGHRLFLLVEFNRYHAISF